MVLSVGAAKVAVETLLADYADATSGKTIAERWAEVERARPSGHWSSIDYKAPVEAACEAFNAALDAALSALHPKVNDTQLGA